MPIAEKSSPTVLIAIESFAAEIEGLLHIVRTGDRRLSTDAVVLAHANRFRDRLSTD